MAPSPPLPPTPLLPETPTHTLALLPRQATSTVIQTIGASPTSVATTSCSGQYTSGALAGAIIGTFFGTILLLYLINSLQNRRKPEVTVIEKRTRNGGSRRHRSHSGSSSVRRPSRVYSTG
ncbi:hypothetical protein PMZ80_007659 [Knufia obscura]|uniref:Transmembrane protein n=1 Tax=Knufia obscura TaxID=1635080 RepID=A0ABR0RJE8_9EURO|nr:hypothetical protein PMZ80_007659 [Knufia obscura]